MEVLNKKILICVALFSVISFSKVSCESDPSFEDTDMTGELAKQANNKENDFIKQLKSLRFHVIVKLKERDGEWKTLPVASAVKLWGDNKFLITEPTFSKVEGYLKRGDNKEAIAAFDSFIRISAQNASSTAL